MLSVHYMASPGPIGKVRSAMLVDKVLLYLFLVLPVMGHLVLGGSIRWKERGSPIWLRCCHLNFGT